MEQQAERELKEQLAKKHSEIAKKQATKEEYDNKFKKEAEENLEEKFKKSKEVQQANEEIRKEKSRELVSIEAS